MGQKFDSYISDIAERYIAAKTPNEFPVPLGVDVLKRPSFDMGLEEVVDMVKFNGSATTLFQIAFFAEFSRQDNTFPSTSKESWELFRRSPTFFAFNPNHRDSTSLE